MRELLKRTAYWLAVVLVSPELLSYFVRSRILGADRALKNSMQLLGLIPGLTGEFLRRAFLSQVLARCHPSILVEPGACFSKAGARIGRNVYVGPASYLGLVELGDDVLIGSGVHITSGKSTHGTDDLDKPIREQEGTLTLVRIGRGTWIGSNAVVMANVGENCVVAAGAVVTQEIPDAVVAAGVPARVIKSRRAAHDSGGAASSGAAPS